MRRFPTFKNYVAFAKRKDLVGTTCKKCGKGIYHEVGGGTEDMVQCPKCSHATRRFV